MAAFLRGAVNGKDMVRAQQAKAVMESYRSASPTSKRKMVHDFFTEGGKSKGLSTLCTKSTSNEMEIAEGNNLNWLTLGQIADLIAVPKAKFASEEEWKNAILQEVELNKVENQLEYELKGGKDTHWRLVKYLYMKAKGLDTTSTLKRKTEWKKDSSNASDAMNMEAPGKVVTIDDTVVGYNKAIKELANSIARCQRTSSPGPSSWDFLFF